MKKTNVAYLFLTHVINNEIIDDFSKIESSSKDLGDAWFLFQGEISGIDADKIPTRTVAVSLEDALSLGYPSRATRIVPGHTHYPVIWFARKYSQYKHYWVIEYDCRFSGTWRVLFDAFGGLSADFLASHICTWDEEPEWPNWELRSKKGTIHLENRLRCFHPIYRISRSALFFIDQAHKQGWVGHSEVLIPTLLHMNSFILADFGGDGKFVPEGMKNQFYTWQSRYSQGSSQRGTLRYRPVYSRVGSSKNKIYHPVKNENRLSPKLVNQILKSQLHAFFAGLTASRKKG